MKINLVTQEQYNTLLSIYENNSILSLQNKGYEGINKESLTQEQKDKIKEVEVILKESICGFSSFQNFRLDKDNKIQLRLQYNYGYGGGTSFTGVGYILLDELLNGFN
jgi:hypothetical protein